jgi:parallel beta-helix repeat protein
VGIGFWSAAENSEVTGNIVVLNGWYDSTVSPPKPRGHGIYAQNQNGTKLIADNIVVGNFDYGLHVYGSSQAYLDHFRIEGNIVGPNGGGDGLLLGGGRAALNNEVRGNLLYSPLDRRGGGLRLGYQAGCVDLLARDNVIVGQRALSRTQCDPTLLDNRIVGRLDSVHSSEFPGNEWWQPTAAASSWPAGMWAFLRLNRHDARRAHLAVYRWDQAASVDVDITAMRPSRGDLVTICDVQSYFGSPVWAGMYDGRPIPVPLAAHPVSQPISVGDPLASSTLPQFGAFVITISPDSLPQGSPACSSLAGLFSQR